MTSSDPTHLPGYALGMEAAARICEEQAQEFLSPEYASPQPVGSITERFACNECARAIRAQIATPDSADAQDAFSDGPGPSLDGVMKGDLQNG